MNLEQIDTVQKVNFKLVSQKTQQNACFTLTFNDSSTLVIGGFLDYIIIYRFENCILKKQQALYTKAFTIFYMPKLNKFVSGGSNGSIIIWSLGKNKLWQYESNVQNGHRQKVFQIIMNKNQDLIISCCTQGKINFSSLQSNWRSVQIIDQQSVINSICLNESNNQLVSIGDLLFIYQHTQDKLWTMMQTIYLYGKGLRVAFIRDLYITAQVMCGQHLDIFKLNQQSQEFERYKTIKLKKVGMCSILQPQTYNKTRQLLLNKNGCYLYLINNTFDIEQEIKFESSNLRATISEDGQYLISWDSGSDSLQVRKQYDYQDDFSSKS